MFSFGFIVSIDALSIVFMLFIVLVLLAIGSAYLIMSTGGMISSISRPGFLVSISVIIIAIFSCFLLITITAAVSPIFYPSSFSTSYLSPPISYHDTSSPSSPVLLSHISPPISYISPHSISPILTFSSVLLIFNSNTMLIVFICIFSILFSAMLIITISFCCIFILFVFSCLKIIYVFVILVFSSFFTVTFSPGGPCLFWGPGCWSIQGGHLWIRWLLRFCLFLFSFSTWSPSVCSTHHKDALQAFPPISYSHTQHCHPNLPANPNQQATMP